MKRAQCIALLKLIGGWAVALTIVWGGIVAAQAQTDSWKTEAPERDAEGWRSGARQIIPAPVGGVQADLQQTSTYTILSYVPFGKMEEGRTHHVTGAFSGTNDFGVCAGARNMVYTSTGITCTYDPDAYKISCPAGLTGIVYSYTCTFTPTAQLSFVYRGYSISSTYDIDRLVDVYFSPLLYLASTLQPTLVEPGHLRWVSPNSAYFGAYVTYVDPRKTFVPIVRQE